jgi:Xaa-Pro dipeptidase
MDQPCYASWNGADAQAVRQRRPFFYLSGCDLPDSCLTYNIATTELTLFIPPIEPEEVIWSGLPLSPSKALEKYDVDKVLPTTELNVTLASYAKSKEPMTVFAIPEQVSEDVTFLGFAHTEFWILRKAIEDERVTKDIYEISLIAKANEVSALAHKAVLDRVKTASNERELEATFIATCIAHGCRDQAYPSIVAGGTNAATLHYTKNDDPLQDRLNVLLDAGGEYKCYCSDVTRTFPISGSFSKESQIIYDIVDEMQSSCFKMLEAGVMWDDVHMNAHRVAIKGLKAAGLLKGDDQEIFDARVSVAFFPHGLGHYLGMDTHDTGGKANYADADMMFRYLRVRGKLPKDSVITVEPGVCVLSSVADPMSNVLSDLFLQIHYRSVPEKSRAEQVH